MRFNKLPLRDALIPAIINGLINGLITLNRVGEQTQVPISLDSISTTQLSVWGIAVSLTFGLGIILSLITSHLTVTRLKARYAGELHYPALPSWRVRVGLALSHCAALAGWFICLAVIWTKYVGVVMVSGSTASILVAGFAFIVTVVIETRTRASLLYRKMPRFDDVSR
ncbi:permease [Citrobacter portucalensis]|uniref:permease n=1 Tax=Citrobacter portucalensis TaxID=1639133 RepID=UPI003C2C8F8C